MKSKDLILKCFAEFDGSSWTAVCLDFTLAAQADTYDEAKSKLEIMIVEYLDDVFTGDDKLYADQLLSRSAPFSLWAKYYWMVIKNKLCHKHEKLFDEVMPLRIA